MGLLPADTYIVKNATILNNEDRLILIKLYQPIVGSTAINLYFTLWSNLDTSEIIGSEYTHHNLMASMRLKLNDILESREKLEAIGLLKTYIKTDSINNYIYDLYSPLSPLEFFENPILATTLESNIGQKEYEKTLKFFEIPKINLKGYQNITASFSGTYDVTNFSETNNDIRKVSKLDLIIDEKIDLNSIISLIPNEILNHKSITNEIKTLIYKLAYIYNLKDNELTELIRNSVNEKHIIDKDLLRTNCHNFYTFENQNYSPSLIYKNQPEYLRKETTDTTKKSKLIYTFETTSPYDFLSGKNKGVKPDKKDLLLLENLMVDYDLNPGVVNVLIDYVLKINDNKLTKNFVLTIANQWKRSNIKTVSEAMEICKKENKTKINRKTNKILENKPTWFDQQVEEKTASTDEIQKLEASLKDI
jgi:replication initiation and membrane attachment protein